MKPTLKIFILLFCITISGLVLLYVFQGKLLYAVPNVPVLNKLPDNVSKIELEGSYAYLLKPISHHGEQFPLMIFSHGNAESADMWVNRFDYLIRRGIAVLIVEYPGYGGAQGEANLETINSTMLNAFDKAVNLPFINENFIIAYGRSIGGGPASLLAIKRPLAALALESTFSDLPKLMSQMYIPSFLLKDRYNNQKIIESLEIPVFIFHGTQDELIPFSHAETLKQSAKNVTFHSEKCGHNDCPPTWQALIDFLEKKTDIEVHN